MDLFENGGRNIKHKQLTPIICVKIISHYGFMKV